MENIKQLGNLIDLATSDAQTEPAHNLFAKILEMVNSRVDMPRHAIAALSKRISIKNKKVLFWSFFLLQYLAYNTQLSMYTQISTKEFLFKISGILMAKDIDGQVQDRILRTLHCLDQLFRPHDDLLPLFFQFYAQVLKKGFQVPTDYVSPYRPKQLKKYAKPTSKYQSDSGNDTSKPVSRKNLQKPTKVQAKTFEQIREKLILTNDIIDNSDPAQGVKGNQLLIEMMQEIKQCEKKINETINANPNQNIMQMALAANDDLYITYRRFKDLQRNKKPEPFILTEMASELSKQQQNKSKIQRHQQYSQPRTQPQPVKKKVQNILDLDFEPQKPSKKNQSPVKQSGDIFDLMDISQPQKKQQPKQSNQLSYEDLLGGGLSKANSNPYGSYNNNQFQSNYNYANISLGQNKESQGFSFNGPSESQFRTDADIKPYGNSAIQQLTDLSNFKDFLGSSK